MPEAEIATRVAEAVALDRLDGRPPAAPTNSRATPYGLTASIYTRSRARFESLGAALTNRRQTRRPPLRPLHPTTKPCKSPSAR